MPSFGPQSLAFLEGVHPQLVVLAKSVVGVIDHGLICGPRTPAEQEAIIARGATHTTDPLRSYHVVHPGRPRALALDLCLYHPKYGRVIGCDDELQRIAKISGKSYATMQAWMREQYTILGTAYVLIGLKAGMKMIWGGDWNRNWDTLDNSFDDLCHVEYHEGEKP